MEQSNFKRFKKIYNYLAVIIVITFLFSSMFLLTCKSSTPTIKDYKTEQLVYTNKSDNSKEKIKSELVLEVSKYINSKAKNSDNFIPKYIVSAALEHNIDICFIMAQTQIETNYGTTGIGKSNSKKSIFGVIGRGYKTYEDAVYSYCKLLKRSYLVKGKTEQHLMTKYVTGTGYRYAANPKYEKELTKAYNNIKKSTKIYSLQQDYKKIM